MQAIWYPIALLYQRIRFTQTARGYPLQLSIAWQWVEFKIVLKKEGPSPGWLRSPSKSIPRLTLLSSKRRFTTVTSIIQIAKYRRHPQPIKLVIDLQNMSIDLVPIDCRHMAISYVWVRITEKLLNLTRESMLLVRQRNSLVEGRLPHTIQDTIQLCTDLGERGL